MNTSLAKHGLSASLFRLTQRKMKHQVRWVFSAIVAPYALSFAPEANAQSLGSSLITHFTFDSADWGSGVGGIKNSQGTGNASILAGTGTITNLTSGRIGQAAKFTPGASPGNASITGVNVNDANVGLNSFSVSLWLNNASNTGVQTLVDKGAGENTRVGWKIQLFNAGATNQVIVGFNDSTTAANFVQKNYDYSPSGGFLNNWVHLALVVDRDADTATIYINGTALTSTTGNNTIRDLGSLSTSNYALNFGTRYPATTGQLPFNGNLDDLGIWTRALSSGEITSIYNNGLAGIAIPEPSVNAFLVFALVVGWKLGKKGRNAARESA